MIGFANPWAWIGAVGFALPVAIHLLRRHRAARRPFPTLRFLPEARVVAVRRHRLTDVPLMLVRMLAIVAAVMAVAQPVWRDRPELSASASTQLARAVVVDRSSRASAEVAALPPASTQVVVQTSTMRQGLEQAIGWTSRQQGRREIVVISSFPIGSLSPSDVAAVPVGVGLRFVPIPIVPVERWVGAVLSMPPPTLGLAREIAARPGDTEVSWTPARGSPQSSIEWRTTSTDIAALALATDAALSIGVADRARDHHVTVVLPEAPERPTLLNGAQAIDRPWMFDVIRALAADPALASAVRTMSAVRASLTPVFTPIVCESDGSVLLAAAASGQDGLLLVSNAPAATMFTAALAAAVPDADRAIPWAALETQSIANEVLERWQRPTAPSAPIAAPATGLSIARWFWMAALVWIALEAWWRRRPEVATPSAMVNERVA